MADSTNRAIPEGWRIDGLWTGIASNNPHYHHYPKGTQPTDADVAAADRIVVTYTSRRTGVTDYRTIPGASSRRQVGALIRYTTRRVSPPGKRSR
jgi:hypothetical protein